MLSKNKIDKKLRKYIREHLGKGYSRHAVRKVLVDHGYNESYVDGLLRNHSEIQFVKKYTFVVSLLFIISIFSFNLTLPKEQPQKITAYAALSSGDEGCCTSICQQTYKNECYGSFVKNNKCNELQECNVGCCIDKEGYCITNYLYGNCISGDGTSINRDCNDIIFCTNITDKSYSARLYNTKNKKGAGIFALEPVAGYYGSSFNIRYYLYDKTNVLSVKAEIKDADQIINTTLYDEGSHSDGVRNDNIYGNNWVSSNINDFDGFKKLDVDIIVRFADGAQQPINKVGSIVVLNNNKCLPIYTEWSNSSQKRSIIFAANNYESSNGYQKFESDVNNFLAQLFSIPKFSNNKDNFNIYRFENSLSYSNTQTIIDKIPNSCPYYSNNKDFVIIFDQKEDYCISENNNVVRVNSTALFYNNVSNAEMNEIFAGFCGYIWTPKKWIDELINLTTPPKIVVYTLDNITYNTNITNLSFSVSTLASNYPITSSVFLEDVMVFTNVSDKETSYNVTLNLASGTNIVQIEATDKNNNFKYSPLLLLNVT